MACALVIGDPHFKVSNASETNLMSEAIIKIAREKVPDFIVILGDILDRHSNVHTSPLCRSIKFIEQLINIAPTYILIGNHDLANNRQFLSEEHPFTALKLINNLMKEQSQSYQSILSELFTLVPEESLNDRLRVYKQLFYQNGNIFNVLDKVTIIDKVISIDIKGQQFVFTPYTPPSMFQEALNTIDNWETAKCIFSHQEYRGCQMGAIISTDGDEWPITNPFIISGHIHEFQLLQSNILYPGTPIQHTYSDHVDKTILWVDFNEEIIYKRIDLGLPHKSIVHITCSEVEIFQPPPNSQLKIVISGHSGEIKAIMKHQNIDSWKQMGHKITYKDIPLDQNTSEVYVAGTCPPKFSTALQNAIAVNPNLTKLYNNIFGTTVPAPEILVPKPIVAVPTIIPKIEPKPIVFPTIIPKTPPKTSTFPKFPPTKLSLTINKK